MRTPEWRKRLDRLDAEREARDAEVTSKLARGEARTRRNRTLGRVSLLVIACLVALLVYESGYLAGRNDLLKGSPVSKANDQTN